MRPSVTESFNLQGPIQPGDWTIFRDKLSKLIAAHGKVKTVCLNSSGGDNGSASLIAAEIKRLGLNTCVGDISYTHEDPQPDTGIRYTDECVSACTLILLAGKERTAFGNRFKLGLHSTRGTVTTKDSVAMEASGGRPISYTDPAMLEAVYEIYKDKTSVTNEQLHAILEATSRTPAFKMYSASVEEQMTLGFFTQRAPQKFTSTQGARIGNITLN